MAAELHIPVLIYLSVSNRNILMQLHSISTTWTFTTVNPTQFVDSYFNTPFYLSLQSTVLYALYNMHCIWHFNTDWRSNSIMSRHI